MTKKECTANHDVFEQCPYCGWTRKPHKHRFTVVIRSRKWRGKSEYGFWDGFWHREATKVMCPCGEAFKEL